MRRQPLNITVATPGRQVQNVTYGFNAGTSDNGNVMSIANNLDSTRTQTFTYDQLNRIASGKTTATTGTKCFGANYGMDEWNNLLSVSVYNGYSACNQGLLPTKTVNAGNQLVGYTYDAAGNMTNDGTYTYVYDAEGHQKTVGAVTYSYDGLGRRVKKSTGTLYWYGAGGSVMSETNTSGTAGFDYVFFGGQRFARADNTTGGIFHYFGDALGSSRVIVQSDRNAACYDADFEPYGGEHAITNTCAQNYKFTGLERDTDATGVVIDHTQFRQFDNNLGRWMSPDPLGGDITNPQSLNRYAYALNSPCSYADPLGLDSCNLNGQFINDAGLTNAQVTAAEQQINQLLGSVPSTNGDTVGINWVTSGQTDATLTATNQSWFGEYVPRTSGAMGAEGPVLSPRVYVNNLPSGWTGSLVGAVGLHELGHYFGFTRPIGRDLAYDASNPNTMMFDYMPPQTQTDMLLNPNSSLWELSPSQIGSLFQNCKSKHGSTPSPGRPGGGGGGYGGGSSSGGGWVLMDNCGFSGEGAFGCSPQWVWWPGWPIGPVRK